MMRILQICTRFPPGGIQRHVLDLTAWLRERGHHVALAGSPGAWMDETKDADFLPLDLSNVAQEGGALPARLAAAGRAAARLRGHLARHPVDLIHAHESAPALVARLATLGRRTPIMVTYHGSEPERVREFGRIANFAAQRVITPSHRTAEDLAQRGGVPQHKLQVIGLGVPAKPQADPKAVAELRARLLGAHGRRLVLTIARLSHQKGVDVLIEVARRVGAANPGVRFAVVGDGPLRRQVEQAACDAGVSDRLAFLGASNTPELYLAAADLFLLTSRWEALPITIVEAFRAGLPVIATDCGGVVELVDPSVGKVTDIGDVDALTTETLRLTGDDALRARLSAAALARSGEDRFQPEHINRIFEATYQDVIAGGRP